MDSSSVILAVASPAGRSLRGIVRLSGAGCLELVGAHVRAATDDGAWDRGARLARLCLDGMDVACVMLVFPAPGSYTGQDSVELQLPGNPDLLQRVIDALIDSGRQRGIEVRRAEAGEFTARAFLGGRMTLTEAEGVAATIAAESDAQLRAAGLLTSGRLGSLAHDLADELAGALALVEAGIDFSDQEDVVAIAPDDLGERLILLRDRIDDQLSRSVGTEQLQAIPWVVLAGPPNAGKSTLFNALLGRSRAVVSERAGTTRDVLAEPLTIDTPHGAAEVMLIDLAGADVGPGVLNRAMQSAAGRAMERAELVLWCVAPGQEDDGDLPAAGTAPSIVIHTKADTGGPGGDVRVSARAGTGIQALQEAIARRLADRAVSLAADAVALRPRHEQALRGAQRGLVEAIDLVEPARASRHLPAPELVAAAMRGALNDLSQLAGDITPNDVLGRVFATFCIGK